MHKDEDSLKNSEPLQPEDDVQTSGEPTVLFEVEPSAQAHIASLSAVPSVLLYVVPLLQTVVAAHSLRIRPDDVDSVVDAEKEPTLQGLHSRSCVSFAAAE